MQCRDAILFKVRVTEPDRGAVLFDLRNSYYPVGLQSHPRSVQISARQSKFTNSLAALGENARKHTVD
jgi:hypothetical protein